MRTGKLPIALPGVSRLRDADVESEASVHNCDQAVEPIAVAIRAVAHFVPLFVPESPLSR